jgi:hypothetical protein
MRFFAVLLCLTMLSSQAFARAPYIPPKTGEFLAFCVKHVTLCRDEIARIGTSPQAVCAIPETVAPKDAVRAVLDWLSIHSETFDMPRKDGIETADKGVWSCVHRAGDKNAFGVPRDTVRFLRFCQTKLDPCVKTVTSISAAVRKSRSAGLEPEGAEHCPIPYGLGKTSPTKAVLRWIARHSDPASAGTDDAIRNAIDALWPCG